MRVASLTSQQAEIVELGDGAHLVTAPPGSGKTEILVRRVIHLLRRSPGDLFGILALTYTRRAARELEERVGKLVPERDLWQVDATTFHSFALGKLENYGGPVGLKRPVTVISDFEDKRALLLPTLEDLVGPLGSVDHSLWRSLFDEIASRKTDLERPEQADRHPVLGGRINLRDAYQAYEDALSNTGSVDYEGMIQQAVRLIRIDPWVGSHIRGMYRHILVDEGQELTRGQYELLKAIRGDRRQNLFVVADIDQSINSFAGGGPRFLGEFVRDFDATERNLTTNFRSARSIVDILGSLRGRIADRRHPASAGVGNLAGGWVGARSYTDEQSEGEAIGRWIRCLFRDGLDPEWVYESEATEVAPEDIGVLGRTRYGFGAVVADLEKRGIRFAFRTEEQALFESRLGRSVFYALKFMENPADLPARRRLLDEMGGPDALGEKLEEAAKPRTILEECALHGGLPSPFVEVLLNLEGKPANGLRSVSTLIGIDGSGAGSDSEEGRAWHRDQSYLADLLQEYQVGTAPPNRSLSGFLRMLSRLEGVAPSEPGVRILTPHRARGLSFKAVVVMGMNEGTFPYYRATSADQLDEERRVVYVAASRAARALLFTRPRRRQARKGNWYPCQESRFIAEMGLTMEHIP